MGITEDLVFLHFSSLTNVKLSDILLLPQQRALPAVHRVRMILLAHF